ncbi:hypothetical protein [Nocardia sp. NPDC051750]|uniref:hypothetical protein n=1 Tax=Nocardia sp. NPDC051750 TaxID=3364325 RepID=UPI0037A2C946
MGWTDEPTLVCHGNAEIGLAPAGIGCAVRINGRWAWLCWPSLDGEVVARLTGGRTCPDSLAEKRGFSRDLAREPDAALAVVAGVTTPGWWRICPPRQLAVQVVSPQLDHPVVVGPREVLTLVIDGGEPGSGIARASGSVAEYVSDIRAGERPVVLALDITRPDRTDDLALVLDGRHALAAYLSLGVDPMVLLLYCSPPYRDTEWCWHPERFTMTRPLSALEDSARERESAKWSLEQDEWCDCPDRCARPDPSADDEDDPMYWPACSEDDPLEFGRDDLNDALRDQPLTAQQARPVVATVGPGWLRAGEQRMMPGHLVEIPDGLGVVRVQGSRNSPTAAVLWLHNQPVLAKADVIAGTLWQLVARLGPARQLAEISDLIDWLADPEIERDHSGHPFLGASTLARLTPLLRLFEPGQYAVRIVDNVSPLSACQISATSSWTVGDWDAHLDPRGFDVVIPTDTWPPPDSERIAWYRDRIRRGATPLAILVAPGPAGPGVRGEPRFLLDGHHKVAAGASLYVEISPCHADRLTTAEFATLIEPHLDSSPFGGRAICSGGHIPGAPSRPDTTDRTSRMSVAEYYAQFGVR